MHDKAYSPALRFLYRHIKNAESKDAYRQPARTPALDRSIPFR